MTKRNLAFTMAEILLSLTIIGVVAAITLPSLTGNINERTWNTQRKALYARMSQAISLMPALNGYGTYVAPSGTEGTESYDAGTDNVAETFVTAGLSKVLKINNICDSEHLSDCGLVDEITVVDGSTKRVMPKKLSDVTPSLVNATYYTPNYVSEDYKTVGLETANGESIDVLYNPNCKPDMNETSWYYAQSKLCSMMFFDLNGSKGPNTMGKDIGIISVYYPSDSLVTMPEPHGDFNSTYYLYSQAISRCRAIDGGEYRLPTKEEAASMIFALRFYNLTSNGTLHTTSTFVKDGAIKRWIQGLGGDVAPHENNASGLVWCIKR